MQVGQRGCPIAQSRGGAYAVLMEKNCPAPADPLEPAEQDVAPRRKGRLAVVAAERIRAMIVSGEAPPGARLREAALCDRLGISRTPVREALRTLAAEGLVDLLPNRSVVVAPLRAPDVSELFEVFGAIEAMAAEQACAQISDGEVREIGELLNQMIDRREDEDRAAYLKLNQAIHRRVVEVSGNKTLLGVWRLLEPRVERARALPNLDGGRWSEALREHSAMFAALAARDGARLARLTRAHFLNGLPFIAPAPEPKDDGA